MVIRWLSVLLAAVGRIIDCIVDGQRPTRPSDAVLIVGPLTG